MSAPERLATIAARYLATLNRQEKTMTDAYGHYDAADFGLHASAEKSATNTAAATVTYDGDTEEAGDPLGILTDRRRTALAIATAFEATDEPVTSAAQAADLVRRWAQTYAPTT